MKNRNKLIVFTRTPEKGRVKTRLQPQYSEEQSLKLHQFLVKDTLQRVAAIKESDIELCCSPHRQHGFFLDCEKAFDIELSDQSGADLGERMALAFSLALQQYDKVVLIGTDCPKLDHHYIEQAFAALDSSDCVLGPAEDGGYVLIGLSRFIPELFRGIRWGSNTVFSESRKVLERRHYTLHELALMHDLDRAEDLQRYPHLLDVIN